jgi:hypothetical protein
MPAGLRGNPCPHVRNQAGFPGTPACRLGVILTIKGEHLPVPAPGAASAGRKAALRAGSARPAMAATGCTGSCNRRPGTSSNALILNE